VIFFVHSNGTMKVLVGVKRVIDYAVKIRVNPEKTMVDMQNVKMSINPFDEIAVEEAIKLKEKGFASEVVALTVGPSHFSQTLQTSLAMGVDRGIHVETEATVEPLTVAKIFKKVVDKENPRLIIFGKQAIDDDSNQSAQLLAGLLGWPQGTFISKLEKEEDKERWTVTREIHSGLEVLSLELPAVLSCDLRLNKPRFATLQNIMKAKKKPIEKLTPEQIGIDIRTRLQTLRVEEPSLRSAGIKVESVPQLMEHLQKRGIL